jgi:hypothetical protein
MTYFFGTDPPASRPAAGLRSATAKSQPRKGAQTRRALWRRPPPGRARFASRCRSILRVPGPRAGTRSERGAGAGRLTQDLSSDHQRRVGSQRDPLTGGLDDQSLRACQSSDVAKRRFIQWQAFRRRHQGLHARKTSPRSFGENFAPARRPRCENDHRSILPYSGPGTGVASDGTLD